MWVATALPDDILHHTFGLSEEIGKIFGTLSTPHISKRKQYAFLVVAKRLLEHFKLDDKHIATNGQSQYSETMKVFLRMIIETCYKLPMNDATPKMKKKMANITFGGQPAQTIGELPSVGSSAPAFTLTDHELNTKKLSDFEGSKLVLNIFPSVNTGVCSASVRKFNQAAGQRAAARNERVQALERGLVPVPPQLLLSVPDRRQVGHVAGQFDDPSRLPGRLGHMR